ncbi:MAG TPA: ABC transporter permease [Puia sp.]|nr:ABC transporter permease [Puia sp.]
MFSNYFKIGWRNLLRHKSYAAINIAGLSLGIACCILIFTLIGYHLSFDNFHLNKERIYRITTEFHEEKISYQAAVPQPLGKAFRTDFSFGEKTARVVSYRDVLVSLPGEKEIKKFQEEQGVVFAEPAFFDIFNFPLVQGDPHNALLSPNSAIITESIARKYFGADPAMGKLIRFNNHTDFTVRGILRDLPANTDRRQEIYLSYDNLKDHNPWLASDSSWPGIYSGSMAYTLLKPNVTAAQVNKALPLLSNKYYNGRDAKTFQFRLQPLSDIHFNTAYDGYADKKYLWALAFIGIFLIVTACVNFVNLATAQALNRSKEVGIRKVLGSLKAQLFWQFIAETTLITVFALLVAYGLTLLAMPPLNQLLKSKMELHLFSSWQLPTFLLSLTAIVIFLSGSYPGLVLARFQPVLALKSKLSQAHIGGFSLRRVLVVTQFTISQMLIIGTIVIASQVNYSKGSDLGFDKEAILTLPIPAKDNMKMTTLRNRLAEVPGVEKISLCYQAPASRRNTNTNVRFANRAEDEHWSINAKAGDDQYLATFGLKLAAGRNFYPSDTVREFLVNETFVKQLNLHSPQEVIGQRIAINGDGTSAPIVGVVKDFYNYSFHSEISPICIMTESDNYATCGIRINLRNTKPALAAFEKIWNDVYPQYLYSFSFLDDSIADFYRMDNIMLTLIEVFAGIAILIGSLGLYGLVSFMAVRKTREIGVRKVLGAGLSNILWLFGKEFSRLLVIAFVIAAPIAWWTMHLYLQDFKYRIPIGPGIFALAILVTFMIAALTVGYRSLRSALTNPVKSLRSE